MALPLRAKSVNPIIYAVFCRDAYLFFPVGEGRFWGAGPFRFRRHTGFPSRAYQIQRKGLPGLRHRPLYQGVAAYFAHIAELYLWDFQG